MHDYTQKCVTCRVLLLNVHLHFVSIFYLCYQNKIKLYVKCSFPNVVTEEKKRYRKKSNHKTLR